MIPVHNDRRYRDFQMPDMPLLVQNRPEEAVIEMQKLDKECWAEFKGKNPSPDNVFKMLRTVAAGIYPGKNINLHGNKAVSLASQQLQ